MKVIDKSYLEAFQSEMESAFMLDCNPEDVRTFPEAKKLANAILRSRKQVTKIMKKTDKVLNPKPLNKEGF